MTDLFDYDYEEMAERLQSRVDRLTVNFLRHHGARVRRDDVDFHGFEHVDLELTHGGHTLVLRQSGHSEPAPSPVSTSVEVAIETFESLFDGQPASDVQRDLLAQWLALLPEGEARQEGERSSIDPSNPFLADQTDEGSEPIANPFLSDAPKRQDTTNPFAPRDGDKKKRAALDWLTSDD
jgi:hypothetical protein